MLGTSFKWNYIIVGHVCLTLTYIYVFEVFPYCNISNFHFCGWVIFHLIPHSPHPFIWWWELGSFPLGMIVNSAAVNTVAYLPVWVPAFMSLGHMPKSAIAGSYGNFVFNYVNYAIMFNTVAAPFYIPIINAQRFQFLHLLCNTCYFPHLVSFLLFYFL